MQLVRWLVRELFGVRVVGEVEGLSRLSRRMLGRLLGRILGRFLRYDGERLFCGDDNRAVERYGEEDLASGLWAIEALHWVPHLLRRAVRLTAHGRESERPEVDLCNAHH